jgi:NAD(P)-dependent dehydrogenase (short-subunit alcohol dehydrogenase family)
MFTRSLSFPLREKGITAITMDPGWVQTRMGGREAPLQPEESISGMLKVIDDLTLEDTGRYLRHDGEELPW